MSAAELFAEPTASAYRRVALLGDLSVVVDGRLCRITAPKQRAVLAHLALEPGVAVSADRLLTNIWGDDQPAGGPKAVAFQVTKLRDALEPERVGEGSMILTSTSGYLLDVDPRSVDLHDAAAMIDDAAASLDHDPAKAAGLAEDAMGLWRGAPFADVLSSPVLDDERRRIDLLHQRLQVIAHEAGLALGDHAAILPDIAQLAARHPLDEQIAALYLRALDGSGRTADALRAYGELRDRLVDELGIDPSPELQRLELSLLEREAPPPTRATSPQPAKGVGLPAPTTSLIGRVDEIEAIVEQLADDECRSLTLLGPGGVGKTRLAIAAASRWADLYRQPVWFCALASVDSTSPMIEPFAAAVGFTVDDHMASMPGMDDRTQFLDYLAGLSGLLVVDNAEHVGRVPALVADIAARCPDVTTLVTSRERLATSIEWVRIVAGLRSDADQDHAAALFAARARQAGAVLSGDDRATITRICVATDGLPMALELSAALAGGAELVEIADRLERDALTIQTDAVDVDPRHASLSATFEASWALLDPDLRDVLARLSVFPGPFTADAAREIAEAGASTLARLVMKSLVRRPGSTFDLHPLIRQFAAAKLTSPDATRQAHSTHYLERVAGRTRTLLGAPDQMAAVAAVDDEIEHIRAAAMWQAEHIADVEADVRLTEAIHALSAYGFVRSEASWSETLRGIADRVEVTVGPERALAHASYLWARAYHGYPDAMLEADGTLEAMQALEPHLGQLDPKAHAWCLMNQAICTEAAADIAPRSS